MVLIRQRVIFSPLPSGFFLSAGKSWLTLDLPQLKKAMHSAGIDTEVVPIDQLIEVNFTSNDIVIYTSSDETNIRAYIKDVLYFINKKCTLVPSYESLLAHENKGFQELVRKDANIGNLPGYYHYDLNRVTRSFPFVYKKVSGAGGSGVSLLRNTRDFNKLLRRRFRISIFRKLKLILRKLALNKKEFSLYKYRYGAYSLYVQQDYIPDLKFDYKVLVFGDRYFVLKRFVRKNDFRASGSGKFDFSDVAPDEILDFSSEIFNRLDVPFVSLDIAQSNDGCHLIEYQVLDFGPVTLMSSNQYYTFNGKSWCRTEGVSGITENYSRALIAYIEKIFIDKGERMKGSSIYMDRKEDKSNYGA